MVSEEEALRILREIIENTKLTINKYPVTSATKMYNLRMRLDDISRYIQHDKLRLFYYRFKDLGLLLVWKWDYLLQEQVRQHLEASLSKEDAQLNAVTMCCINGIRMYCFGDSEGRAILDIQRLKLDLEDEECFKAAPEELRSRILSELTVALTNILDSFSSSRREEASQFCDKLIQACNERWNSVFHVIDDYTLAADKMAILEMRR